MAWNQGPNSKESVSPRRWLGKELGHGFRVVMGSLATESLLMTGLHGCKVEAKYASGVLWWLAFDNPWMARRYQLWVKVLAMMDRLV